LVHSQPRTNIGAKILAKFGLGVRWQQVKTKICRPDCVGLLDNKVSSKVESFTRSIKGESDKETHETKDGGENCRIGDSSLLVEPQAVAPQPAAKDEQKEN
jgi:hypothetical protein